MLQYTQNLFEHDRIRKQAKLILIRLFVYTNFIVAKELCFYIFVSFS
jgi:hypothetical protein